MVRGSVKGLIARQMESAVGDRADGIVEPRGSEVFPLLYANQLLNNFS